MYAQQAAQEQAAEGQGSSQTQAEDSSESGETENEEDPYYSIIESLCICASVIDLS